MIVIDSAEASEGCGGIQVGLWSLVAFHVVTGVFSAMALCGLEKAICGWKLLTAFVVFDLIVLTWAQVTYFRSQAHDCQASSPALYFYLMAEIMFF